MPGKDGHDHLIRPRPLCLYKLLDTGDCRRRGGLDVKAPCGHLAQGARDLVLRHGEERPAACAHHVHDLRAADRLGDGDPLGDRWFHVAWWLLARGVIEGRAVPGLHGDQPGHVPNDPGLLQLGKAQVRAQEQRPIPGGQHHNIGRLPAQLLAHLKGKGLGALEKEGVPGMAGIVGVPGSLQDGIRRVLARARHAAQVRPIPPDLGHLGRRRVLGDIDRARDAGPGAVGGDRAPGVPRRVLDDLPDAQFDRLADQHRRAPILVRAGRKELILLDPHRLPADLDLEQRGKPFVQRDDVGLVPDRQGFPVAPHRRFARGDAVQVKGRLKEDVQGRAAVAAPPWIVQRVARSARCTDQLVHLVSLPGGHRHYSSGRAAMASIST